MTQTLGTTFDQDFGGGEPDGLALRAPLGAPPNPPSGAPHTKGYTIHRGAEYRYFERANQAYRRFANLHVWRPSEATLAEIELGPEVAMAIDDESCESTNHERVIVRRAARALTIEVARLRGRASFLALLNERGVA